MKESDIKFRMFIFKLKSENLNSILFKLSYRKLNETFFIIFKGP